MKEFRVSLNPRTLSLWVSEVWLHFWGPGRFSWLTFTCLEFRVFGASYSLEFRISVLQWEYAERFRGWQNFKVDLHSGMVEFGRRPGIPRILEGSRVRV